jgi:TatD DNase family protein
MIIDTHAHLSDAKYDADRDEVLKRAFASGVEIVFEIACETSDWDKALELSKKDGVFAAFGVHPLNLDGVSCADFKKLEEILKTNKKAIALGEIGLDYHYDDAPSKEIQKEFFIKQLEIALTLEKPLIIHCRDAYEDMIEILKNYTGLQGVLHCFLGNAAQAKEFLDMGLLLGIDGPVTYPKSNELREAVLQTDISKLLIETDCPYLPPQKYRGQRNEPSYIEETLKAVAAIKKLSYEEAAAITSKNALNLFNIPKG